jgi:predicted CXXCH cytochrome family protein
MTIRNWRIWVFPLALVAVLMAFLPSATPGHVGSAMLPEGCGSCHVGHGLSGEPMLSHAEENHCYQCHGSDDERSRMIDEGRLLAGANLKDVEAQFLKPFRHPVAEGVGHSPREELPELGAGTVSHAECVDCHNPHEKANRGSIATQKVKGYSLTGQRVETSVHEYEICFKCHAETLTLRPGERNILDDFAIDTRSQHPVTRPSKGIHLPSLSSAAVVGGTMLCSDCHRSGDPDAPRGPHGSDYQYLLSGNYDTGVYVEESTFAFEFCYTCHDRSSILANESFPLHREHVQGDPLANRPGTSCYTCHTSHGSIGQPHLLEFNSRAVQPEDFSRRVEYRSLGTESGECYLKCHDHNHGPGRY